MSTLSIFGLYNSVCCGTAGCGGVIDADNGIISTPNYPMNYNSSIECIWLVQAPSGYHIIATFDNNFEITGSSSCNTNYVKV